MGKAGDAVAMTMMGEYHIYGLNGVPRNVKGIELYQEASKLGDIQAHFTLATVYDVGRFGLKKDVEKALSHYEVAAMGGHFGARINLGVYEVEDGKFDRALRHWMMSANMGCEKSLKKILLLCKDGLASRDDYAQALLGYKKAS